MANRSAGATFMPIHSEDKKLEETGPDRRRSRRVPLSFHIEVSGFDSQGQFFRDRAVTADVSDGGCRFELTTTIAVKTPISIQVVHRNA